MEDGKTEALVSYSYVGLSEAGNQKIDAMTQDAFDDRLADWQEWIGRHLAAGA